MTANPLAVIGFMALIIYGFAAGWNNSNGSMFFLIALLYIPAWITAGYLWDMLTIDPRRVSMRERNKQTTL